MATYNVGKRQDDIQEPVFLPEDWYLVELVKDELQKNKAWRDAGESKPMDQVEDAGFNIRLQLKTVSEVPEHDNRAFFKYLPMARPGDDEAYMPNGQTKEDWKADQLFKWATVFGSADGDRVNLVAGSKGYIYLVPRYDEDGNQDGSDISMNQDPRPQDWSPDAEDAGQLNDDDIPFK